MKFEWDEQKNQLNQQKHGVAFEEAQEVFDDPFYVDFYDPEHSDDEHRYLIIGYSQQQRLLIAAYTERADTIRLISARQATRKEKQVYDNTRF
jgi:uncharacterized protein